MSLHSFLAMGGYAVYVWPAYGVFFVVLAVDLLAPVWRRRRIMKQVRSRMARQQARDSKRSRTAQTPHTHQ